MSPCLYIFSGLPGTGKTALARGLSRHLGAAYLRIDTIEQGLRDLCGIGVEGEGYRLAYRIAEDNLRVGTSVVADSCNPIELTRREWESAARECGADFLNIEVVCSDRAEHRKRVEGRTPDIPGLRLPTWDQVANREYHAWAGGCARIDTAGKSESAALAELLEKVSGHRGRQEGGQ